MIGNFLNIFKIPDLTRRILFTLALLAVYRIGVSVPTPGTDTAELVKFFNEAGQDTIFGLFNLFSGGAFQKFAIFTLGIMPYISASIILQLLTVVWPRLEQLSKEGEQGRRKITQYTRYLTVGLAAIQALGISMGLEQMKGGAFVLNPGWGFRILTVITLTSGTAFIMWLGEQISERGIGNGISLIIFAGIVDRFIPALLTTFEQLKGGDMKPFVAGIILIVVILVFAGTVLMQQAMRKIPVQYAKRVVGRRMMGGQSTHIPLRINTAGVIPVIFAQSLIMFPLTIAKFLPTESLWVQTFIDMMSPGHIVYTLLYVGLIIFFCYFYTAIIFNPADLADNMKKYGGFIPGIRPGKRTSDYIDKVLTRITLVGAVFLSIIAILPTLLISGFNVRFFYGGTALLIVVGVGLDTVQQIESHLLMRHYDGFLKGGIVGRRR